MASSGTPHRPDDRPDDRSSQVYDITTPDVHESQEQDIRRRRRIYFRIMVPCLAMFAFFGFATFVPTPVRAVGLGIAALMPPVAAILGNRLPR